MDKKRLFNTVVLIIPWLSVFFIRKKSFFRFLPTATFISLIMVLFSTLGQKRKWWVSSGTLIKGVPIDFSYILGPYFIGTIWILKSTYGNFTKYLITNAVIDFISAYPIMMLLRKVGLIKVKKLSYTMWYFISITMALLTYGYQMLVEDSIDQSLDKKDLSST